MKKTVKTISLDFEKSINELEGKIEELKEFSEKNHLNLDENIRELEERIEQERKQIYDNLVPIQTVQIARHPQRPTALDYINLIFQEFMELHGDRLFGDDPAIVGGLAFLEGQPVIVIGEQRGKDTKDSVYRNFGMPQPEGYRKALRLMQHADRFNIPIFTFIDTMGAYPGLSAEERGQGEAIARNLREMAVMGVPIITVVIGEGGSGGALAIGVANRVLMLKHAIYSVISPEGCAAILWKDAKKADLAAQALKITSADLLALKVIDEVIQEPLGGAHLDYETTASFLKDAFIHHLSELKKLSREGLSQDRYGKFRKMGTFLEG